ncbi:hypothetical protein J14TS2_00640 [Bacillus sp. J14TS2]|uniref:extracellular solute-binding protein n=1 Tax=Bacillus sp. J14TS2 TaxID=2807188 RepID=UPI001AFD6446|nr:extracellular solute-binding protein [Bacillus sp. J14TS2]GIN69589.1 hypothetical protein J14TS2_00640 [Bacillus sp. J14TS2]
MRRNKWYFLVLILSVFMLIATACDSGKTSTGGSDKNDKQSEEKTLRIMSNVVGGKTPEENKLFLEEIERLTGIKVDMVKPPSDYSQKLLASMSSGDKFDLLLVTKDLMDRLVDQNILTELNDKIEGSPTLSDPSVIPTEEWDLIKYDEDKIYGVFNKFEGGTMPVVRQDWMEKLNLEEPKTLDDFYNVFKAFKEQDPDGNGKDDTYGLATAGLYDIQPFLSAEGVKYKYVINDDGKRTIPISTEKAVPVLEWLAKLYDEGLLDPAFATNGGGEMQQLFLSDKVGMVTYWDAWVGLFNQKRQSEDPDTEFEAKGLPGAIGPDGGMILRRGDPSVWVMPVNAEHTETAMEFLEFWHSEEGNILSTLGIKDHDYTVEDGQYELTDIGEEHSMDHGVVTPNNTNWENPIEVMPGIQEAQEIILENATLEVATSDWVEAEKIVENYAFKAIMGELSATDAVKKMHSELLSANLIDE